ncbi:MAG: CoB--CoM heterodisulfide reductase iron-sulfur subunit B family protein [Planctomycetota bacterium]
MKYGYYPGCSLHSTSAEYDISFRAIAENTGIELAEVPGWVCCGTSPAHATSHLLSIALPIKNLALAESAGLNDLAVPCAACFSRFKVAMHETGKDAKLKADVKEVTGAELQGKIKVLHPLEIFDAMDQAKVKELTKKDLSHLKVACYYGCLLTRPPKAMAFDDCEYPMSMDRILAKFGAKTLDWSYKTECCGATFALTEVDAVLNLTHKILENAKAVGANAIAAACPLCQSNLDTRQAEIEAKYNTSYNMPVLYFTQIIGLALGIEPQKLALSKHFVSAEPVLLSIH